MPALQELRNIRGVISAAQLAREAHPFSLWPEGILRSALTEISGPGGCGKTQAVLTLLRENPLARVAWIEAELSIYPPAFALQGVELNRILFCQTPSETLWCAQQILKSNLFDFVILSQLSVRGVRCEALSTTELRRLQLATESTSCSTVLLTEAPTNEGAWTFRQQLTVTRSGATLKLASTKSRAQPVRSTHA